MVTAYLLVDRSPGTLLRAVSALLRAGLQVESNRIDDRQEGEFGRVAVSISGESNLDKVRTILGSISGVVKVEDVRTEGGSAAPAVASVFSKANPGDVEAAERAYQAIARKLESAAVILTPLQRQIAEESWESVSRNIGVRVGVREYKVNYSLGLPMQLDAAIKRIVVPALKPFGKARAGEAGRVILADSTLASGLTSTKPVCHFVSGFIEGLLRESPPTKGAMVSEVRCHASARTFCEFQVDIPRP